jgi:hypothetical protein
MPGHAIVVDVNRDGRCHIEAKLPRSGFVHNALSDKLVSLARVMPPRPASEEMAVDLPT